MRTAAVVGKNFGDEGKGLAVDYLTRHADRPLVVRHNGGSQSGHTVERGGPGGSRFVFHALSSGSLCRAETLWIDSFHPDMYKLGEETERFRTAFGFLPEIWAEEAVCCTVVDDVLLNLALEASRGDRRHGSCGMGINECDLRVRAGFGLRLGDIGRMDAETLYGALSLLRRVWTARRLRDLGSELNAAAEPYLRLLSDDNVLRNEAAAVSDNLRLVKLLSEAALREKLKHVGTLIFEAGQGLLLDGENEAYAPHVTASSTGLKNPCDFLARLGFPLDEVVYVSRSYVTRHGAGPLPCECSREALGRLGRDRTNEPNEWQGQLRYAAHESEAAFVAEVRKDLRQNGAEGIPVRLFLTHLNETDGCIALRDRKVSVEAFLRHPMLRETFRSTYLSASPYSEEVTVFPT